MECNFQSETDSLIKQGRGNWHEAGMEEDRETGLILCDVCGNVKSGIPYVCNLNGAYVGETKVST